MNQKLLTGIIIGIIVVLIVLTFLIGGKPLTTNVATQINPPSPSSQAIPPTLRPTPTTEPGETIMVSAHGFVPDLLKIKSNMSVNFANFSDADTVQIEADDPKDTALNTGAIKNNDTSTPVRLSVGTHKYHNKLIPSETGTIVVQ